MFRELIRAWAFWLMVLVLLALCCALNVVIANARDLGQRADQAPEVRAWYNEATLTAEAQKRLQFKKCCNDADVVHTRFRVDSSTGGDHWFYERDGKWEQISDDIVHWNEQAPDNKPTLFALAYDMLGWPKGTLTCFYPPGGGV